MIEFVVKHMYEKTRNYVFFGITHPEVFLNILNSRFSQRTIIGTKIRIFQETSKLLGRKVTQIVDFQTDERLCMNIINSAKLPTLW